MKVWEIQGSFGLDRLRLAERQDPAPGPGELLLAVRAVALNHRDLTTVDGTYNPKQRLPLVPCSDAAAEVVAVGEGVTRFAAGDRVCPLYAQRWLCGEPERERLRSTLGGPLDGTLAERMAVPAESAVAVPEHLSDEEAATLPCAALTAWSAVVTHGRTRPGDVVVVLGTGGVAVFALQLARLAGARVIVTSSSDDKLARARELGAWATINYRAEPEWGRRVKELTGDRGADLVVEVGGAETLSRSLHAVRMGGTIAMIGALAGGAAPLSVIPILMRQVRVQGVLVGDREGFEAMTRALAAHRLRPVVDRVFPFAEAPAAFRHLASGGHFGKVVVREAVLQKEKKLYPGDLAAVKHRFEYMLQAVDLASERERIESVGLHSQVQLLFQLPNQRVFGCFPQLDLAAGKLPKPAELLMLGPLRDQHASR